MLLVTAALGTVLAQCDFAPTDRYRAEFTDASGITTGSTVRVAGVAVGTVSSVEVRDSSRAIVEFSVDRGTPVLESTKATVRYQNLTGDRYLQLLDGPGSATPLPAGSTIPRERTAPALDLDKLIGGFKPLFRGLDPGQVNALSLSLLRILQGQGGTVESALASTGSLTSTLADRDRVIGEVVDNLRTVLGTVAAKGDQFSETVVQLESLVSGLAADRESLGRSIGTLDSATASVTDLLTDARPALTPALTELDRAAEQLDIGRPALESLLDRLPESYRKLVRTGVYGSFFQFYLCELSIKFTGLDGEPITTRLIGQTEGRCAA
ncbi:MCE family protein [Rhodococcus sp. HNM0569]|nr:MCE family protein [Rhodococcus sp. HNM0569]